MKLTTSHSLIILLKPKLSAPSSSNGARREHDVNRDKQRIIKTAFNYELDHSDDSKKFQDVLFASGIFSVFSTQ